MDPEHYPTVAIFYVMLILFIVLTSWTLYYYNNGKFKDIFNLNVACLVVTIFIMVGATVGLVVTRGYKQ